MPEQSKHILAQTLSGLFHPLLLPLYLGLILLFIPQFAPPMPMQLKWQAMGIIAYSFVILPVGILYLLLKWGKTTSLHLYEQKERFLPMLLIAISYIIGLRLLHAFDAPTTLILLMQGVCLTIMVVAFISTMWKISAHTTAIGGALGIIVLLSLLYRINLSGFATFIVLFAGGIGWARLYLKRHTIKQISYGFMTGFSMMIISFLLHAGM